MKNLFDTILKLIFISTTFISTDVPPDNNLDKHPIRKFSTAWYEVINDENQSISALSYNVWALPIWMPGHDQSARFSKIADSIASRDFEIVCLQEVFNRRVRKELLSKLTTNYFIGSNYQCNQPIIGRLVQKDCYGGLMTLSKYPIMEESFYKFSIADNTSFIERIGSKGFLFTTVLWNGQPINIINTHLYAGESRKAESNRMRQMHEMKQIIENLDAFKLYPTLLFGDLNVAQPEIESIISCDQDIQAYNFITQKMNFVDTPQALDANSYTINSQVNIYCSPKFPKQKLDYIMVHIPKTSNEKIWLSEQGTDFHGKSALSDHLGWKANINVSLIHEDNDERLLTHQSSECP